MTYHAFISRPHTFYFDYDLLRGDEYLSVEVAYGVDDDDIYLESVRYNGRELDTTLEEDRELLAYASERVHEDLIDAAADYGDYLYDMRRDWEGDHA